MDIDEFRETYTVPKLPCAYLNKSKSKVTDPDFYKHFAATPELNTLVVAEGKLTDYDFAEMAKLPNLEEVDIAHTSLTSDDIDKLAELPNLQTLALEDVQITFNRDHGTKSFNHLKKLNISDVYITGPDNQRPGVADRLLAYLDGNINNIETLRIGDTLNNDQGLTDVGLTHLVKLPHLKNLGIEGSDITIDKLFEFKQLESFSSYSLKPKEMVELVYRSPNLLYLDGDEMPIEEEIYRELPTDKAYKYVAAGEIARRQLLKRGIEPPQTDGVGITPSADQLELVGGAGI